MSTGSTQCGDLNIKCRIHLIQSTQVLSKSDETKIIKCKLKKLCCISST